MGLFSKKTNEEKIIEEMKKKKEQVDKLKEEINKMGKLVLKDGKLTKVDDNVKAEAKVPVMESPPMPQAQNYDNIDVDEMVQAERMRRQQQQPTQPTAQARPQVSPPPMTQEEYQYKLQQEMAAYQKLQQQAQMQQAQLQQQAQQEAEEREMLRQQAMQQQYRPPVQELSAIGVVIEMVTGTVIKVNVPADRIESFIEGLSTAIDNQSSFPITSRVINGRNVVSFSVE